MKRLTLATLAALLSAITLIGCSPRPDAPAASESEQKPLVVFCVRHAEKVDSSEDPELSVAGLERAAALAATLRSAEIEYMHSSDFIRTRDTAAPTATDHGLEVALYDPRDLPALVEKLREAGGRHLVVGHSNTTPQLAELLGGQAGSAIDEASEYDRLYVVTVGKQDEASSVLMRYGKTYDPEQE